MKVVIISGYWNVPKHFTGIAKFSSGSTVCYFRNGMKHYKYGPAVIRIFKNKDNVICEYYKKYYYKNNFNGSDNNFTNKTWKKKVKSLKREEKLKIFI